MKFIGPLKSIRAGFNCIVHCIHKYMQHFFCHFSSIMLNLVSKRIMIIKERYNPVHIGIVFLPGTIFYTFCPHAFNSLSSCIGRWLISLIGKGVFLVMTKNAFEPVKRDNSVNTYSRISTVP